MPARKIKALTRTLEMLKVIPVAPKFCTTKEVHSHLLAIDPDVSIRTVQRDLIELTAIFGLEFGESPEGYKWSFAFDSPNQFIPALTKEEALSLKLVQEHLKLFLPSHVFERLTALFKKSEDVIRKTPEIKNWSSLVQAVPQSLSFLPSKINQNHIDNIYTALMNNQWMNIKYANKNKAYKIKPLGVIIRDSKLVLVCQYDGFDNMRHLLVHRLKHAELLGETFKTQFDLRKYIQKQAIAVLLSKENIQLEFEAKSYVKQLLTESSFHGSQKITPISDDWIKVTMDVPHTVELENWLLSQLYNIKLIGPEKLKERVLIKAKAALEINQ